jgi:hypothetical protein
VNRQQVLDLVDKGFQTLRAQRVRHSGRLASSARMLPRDFSMILGEHARADFWPVRYHKL